MNRHARAAERLQKNPELWTRTMFYINAFIDNPKSLAAPYANARGILVNALGFTEESAQNIIQNEITLKHQRSLYR